MMTRSLALMSLLTAGMAHAQETAPAIPAPAPSATWTVFGMDSTAGVMIGIVLMLVFILAIVAVSRNERTTVV
jgi:heme/copper-type cytochrome/quinol oxidase subunit 2